MSTGAPNHDETIHAARTSDNVANTTEGISFIPVSTVKEEMNEMKTRLNKMKPGSMEFMFLQLEYRIKEDNLRLLERMNAISLSTTATKAVCDQTKVNNDELVRSLEGTQETQDQHQVTITSHTKEIQLIHDKISFLEGIVEKQAQEILLLRQANEEQIARGMRDMMYIHNIPEEDDEKDSDTSRIVRNCFKDQMLIPSEIELKKATREGKLKKNNNTDDSSSSSSWKPSPCSILITLANIKDKGVIYNHVQNLKGKKNINNKAYVVTDKLPAGQQEKKRYQNDILK